MATKERGAGAVLAQLLPTERRRLSEEIVSALMPELNAGMRWQRVGRQRRWRSTLRSLPAAARERAVAMALPRLIPRVQRFGELPCEIDAWRRFAKRCGVSPIPVIGYVLASPAERRAWVREVRGGGC